MMTTNHKSITRWEAGGGGGVAEEEAFWTKEVEVELMPQLIRLQLSFDWASQQRGRTVVWLENGFPVSDCRGLI